MWLLTYLWEVRNIKWLAQETVHPIFIFIDFPDLKKNISHSLFTLSLSRLKQFISFISYKLCAYSGEDSQEDQRPGFNFQTVLKLNFLVHFLAFVLAGESLGPDESYYRSVFLIDSTHCWWFLTQSVLLQKLKNVAIFSLREIKYMYYALLATANMLNYRV